MAFSKNSQKFQTCTVGNLKIIQEFAILKTHFLSFCTITSSFISPYSKRNINTFLLWDELPYHCRLNIVNISWVSWAIYLSAAELKRAQIKISQNIWTIERSTGSSTFWSNMVTKMTFRYHFFFFKTTTLWQLSIRKNRQFSGQYLPLLVTKT